MWFLEADTAIRLLAGYVLWTAASAAARRYARQSAVLKLVLVFDLALLLYVSKPLALFYTLYTLVTWGVTRFIGCVRKGRKALFIVCCLLCAAPFFYVRAQELFPGLPLVFTLVGIAYNILKAIDAVYYVYYTGERIPLLTYANFMLFFPVITAGPIFRYRDFATGFDHPIPITGEGLVRSFKRLILGYFKKVVVLALVQQVLARLAELAPHIWLSVVICCVSYLLLWLDMSGYADIAIAMGGFMGVAVPENFKKPLRAASFTQFWRNWHVSLTDWIREHIFVVLNNRRLTKYEGALIGFGTMMVMNLWHGFSLVFLCDGLLNGGILAMENLLGLTTVNRRKAKRGYYVFRCCVTNLIFAFTTIFYTLDPAQLSVVLRGFLRL